MLSSVCLGDGIDLSDPRIAKAVQDSVYGKDPKKKEEARAKLKDLVNPPAYTGNPDYQEPTDLEELAAYRKFMTATTQEDRVKYLEEYTKLSEPIPPYLGDNNAPTFKPLLRKYHEAMTASTPEERARKLEEAVRYAREYNLVPFVESTDTKTTFLDTIKDYTSGDDKGCWFCDIFDVLFNMSNDVSSRLYEPVKNVAIYLVAMGFACYVLFKMITYYISFGAIDPRNFFTELLRPFLYMIFAIILIVNIQQFYTYFITPVTEMTVSFVEQVIEKAGNGTVGEFKQYTSSLGQVTAGSHCGEGGYKDKGFGLGQGVHDAIKCVMQKVSASLLVHMAIGSTFIQDSWGYGKFIFPLWNMLGVGLMIYTCTFIIFLSFPFKLVDAMIRVTFVMALLPLWIICWIFPSSRKFSTKALEMFLNALIVFISLSACMVMIFHILEVSMTNMGDMGKFMGHLTKGEVIEAWNMAYFGGKFFSVYFALMVICFALLKKIESFASHFVSAGNLGVGDAMEKATLSFAVQKPLSMVAKPVMNKIVEKAGDGIGGALAKGYQGIKGAFSKEDKSSPEGENGGNPDPNQSQRPSNVRRFNPNQPNMGSEGERKPGDSGRGSAGGRGLHPSGEGNKKSKRKFNWRFWRWFRKKPNPEKPDGRGGK